MRPGRILSNTISQPANKVRQTITAIAVAAYGQFASDRAIILCPVGGQNTHRDTHQRYAVEWQQFQLAIHKLYVTLRLEADDRDACLVVKPRASTCITTVVVILYYLITPPQSSNHKIILQMRREQHTRPHQGDYLGLVISMQLISFVSFYENHKIACYIIIPFLSLSQTLPPPLPQPTRCRRLMSS